MEISRRGFLASMIGGIAAAAAIRTFPFTVYSFPEKIIISKVMIEFWDADQIITGMSLNGCLASYLDGATHRPTANEIESYLGKTSYRTPIIYGPDWKPVKHAMRWETKTFTVDLVRIA
jgi:hypothetical protein